MMQNYTDNAVFTFVSYLSIAKCHPFYVRFFFLEQLHPIFNIPVLLSCFVLKIMFDI